jgi:glycosyltransferase 2 family protein
LLSAWRWQLLLPPVQLAARYSHLAAFYFIGMFFNIFLPTIVGGDAVKALLLSRETGAPARATMSVFMERNVGLFALLTIATVAAAAGPGAQRVAGIPLILWTLAGWAAFIAANVVMLNVRAYRFADRLIALLPLGQMRLRSESLFQAILPYTRAPLPMLAATALSFVHQAIVIIVVFLNVNALGHAVPISALAVIVPLVSLAGMLPISLNGLGVREALYILFLGQHGLSPDVALSVALLYFAVTLIASLPGGLLYAARRTAR